MSPVYRAGFVLGAVALALACTGRAEPAPPRPEPNPAIEASATQDPVLEAAVKKTIAAYLRAEARSDYDAMAVLFTNDARLKYTYEWGHGYEDTVYEVDFSDTTTWRDEAYLADLDGYQTASRKHRVKRLQLKGDQQAEALVIVTEKYRYQGYSGTAKTKLQLVLRKEHGGMRIARLTSVAQY